MASNPSDKWVVCAAPKALEDAIERVLLELVTWRDAGAREADKPPRSFLKDELLVELAKKSPRSADKLDRITHLPAPVRQRHADAILEAIERGREAEPLQLPEPPEETPEQKFEVDTAWAALQTRSRLLGVDPTGRLAAPTWLIWPQRRDERHVDSPLSTGWRGELLDGWLAAFLRGETRRVSPDDQD